MSVHVPRQYATQLIADIAEANDFETAYHAIHAFVERVNGDEQPHPLPADEDTGLTREGDTDRWLGRYIVFEPNGTSPSGITKLWRLVTNTGILLGEISWHPAWRCYIFAPQAKTIYEKICLRQIAAFCDDRTKEHKADRIPVRLARGDHWKND